MPWTQYMNQLSVCCSPLCIYLYDISLCFLMWAMSMKMMVQGEMGVTKSPEFDIDLNSDVIPMSISDMIKDVCMMNGVSEKANKVNSYVGQLEDEMRKIKSFGRELPLCMLLLSDAIERLKEEKVNCGLEGRPVMKEFLPLKGGGNLDEDGGAKRPRDVSEGKNWMSSAQLWSTNVEHHTFDTKILKSRRKEEDGNGSAAENPYNEIFSKLNESEGGFGPFKRQAGGEIISMRRENNKCLGSDGDNHDLTLSFPRPDSGKNAKRKAVCGGSSLPAETQRKPRRCWSVDLHRRFVVALQQLGGPQVATPKQIRDIMQVEDLTNDEVKSHLQKYRLHVRKLPSSPVGSSNCSMLAQYHYGNVSHADSPQGPFHMNTNTKGTSISREGDEDEKSDGHNWKCRLLKPTVEEQVA